MSGLLAAIAVVLAGCSGEVSEAKRLVAAEVPGAKFRNVRPAPDNSDERRPPAVCGEVSSAASPDEFVRFLVLTGRKEVALDLPEQMTGPYGDVPAHIEGMMDHINSRTFDSIYSIRCAP